MDRARDNSTVATDPKDANVLLDGARMETLVHGTGPECCRNDFIASGEHSTVVHKKHKNKTKIKKTVYIWDMDETLILLKSLLSGQYAEASNGTKDVQQGKRIGRQWERHILQVCDEYFFYEQVENFNEPHLDTWNEYDDGMDLSNYDFNNDGLAQPCDDANKRKLAYRLRSIGNKYAQGLHKLLDNEQIKVWKDLYDVTDAYTDGWLSAGRAFLEECLKKDSVSRQGAANAESSEGLTEDQTPSQNVNVLVTSGTLIPSLVKCLLFQLDGFITRENLYSSWDVGKLQCFLWIKKRFEGPGVQFCVIGDSMEECQAAENLGWPFVKIDPVLEGGHRFPGLSLSTVKHYLHCIYGSSESDEER